MNKSKRPPSRSGEAGFTLLEVLISLVIITMAFTAILDAESGSLHASAKAKQMNIIAMLAKNAMTEMEYDIEGKTFDEFPKTGAKTFEPPYDQGYRWSYEIKQLKFPNLNIAGGKSGEGTSDAISQMTRLITKFLSDALREVDVTVAWGPSNKEQTFSLSTYWVDLNHEFSISE